MGEPGIAPRGGDFAGELEEHLFEQCEVENSLRFVENLPIGKLFLIDLVLGCAELKSCLFRKKVGGIQCLSAAKRREHLESCPQRSASRMGL